VLAVQTVRYLAVFDLTAEGCMLVEPVLPELSKLLGKRMPPPILLGKLRESGINLCPHDRDAPPLHANLTPKTAQLEEEALAEILLLSQTCRIAHSKWNASRTADTVVVSVSPNLPTVRAPTRPSSTSAGRAGGRDASRARERERWRSDFPR
jgi:hypothetical protein